MKLDNFDRAKIGYDKMDAHDKIIWNAAIEAAASMADNRYGNYGMIGNEIRKLKK